MSVNRQHRNNWNSETTALKTNDPFPGEQSTTLETQKNEQPCHVHCLLKTSPHDEMLCHCRRTRNTCLFLHPAATKIRCNEIKVYMQHCVFEELKLLAVARVNETFHILQKCPHLCVGATPGGTGCTNPEGQKRICFAWYQSSAAIVISAIDGVDPK